MVTYTVIARVPCNRLSSTEVKVFHTVKVPSFSVSFAMCPGYSSEYIPIAEDYASGTFSSVDQADDKYGVPCSTHITITVTVFFVSIRPPRGPT